jgi:hypothetical protein
MIKENRVAEIIGKNSQKIIEKLGMKECGLGKFWSMRILKNANMLCHAIHPMQDYFGKIFICYEVN